MKICHGKLESALLGYHPQFHGHKNIAIICQNKNIIFLSYKPGIHLLVSINILILYFFII